MLYFCLYFKPSEGFKPCTDTAFGLEAELFDSRQTACTLFIYFFASPHPAPNVILTDKATSSNTVECSSCLGNRLSHLIQPVPISPKSEYLSNWKAS